MADLAAALAFPVILVVRLQLGCLNHSLLTASAVRQSGLPLAGWVGSATETPMAAQDENVATLKELLPGPCLGLVPYLGGEPDPAEAASYIDLSALGR